MKTEKITAFDSKAHVLSTILQEEFPRKIDFQQKQSVGKTKTS